jgi:hypothetical protein
MQPANRPIFRSEAVRRYAERHEKAVLPRLVRPRVFLLLWFLVGLLLLSAAIAWFARVPTFVSGPAAVVRLPAEASGEEWIAVVVFLPAAAHARLTAGQPVWVEWDGTGERTCAALASVQVEIASPAAVRERYSLGPGENLAVAGPVAVAMAPLDEDPDVPAEARVGSVGQADVQVGSRRIISLLPGLSGWGEQAPAAPPGGAP